MKNIFNKGIKKFPLSYESIDSTFNEPGVYIIFASKRVRKFNAQPIGRCCKKDKEGILYIGKGNIIKDRLREFLKYTEASHTALQSNKVANWNHPGGKRFAMPVGEKPNPNKRTFRPEKLFVALLPSTAPLRKEQEYLTKYFQTFGEVPPLNGTLQLYKR